MPLNHNCTTANTFNSSSSYGFLQSSFPGVPHCVPIVQQTHVSNMPFPQQSYRPLPPTPAPSNQFSFVRAEVRNHLQQSWPDSSLSPLLESKQPVQDEHRGLLHGDFGNMRLEEQHNIQGRNESVETLHSDPMVWQNQGMLLSPTGTDNPCGLSGLQPPRQMVISRGSRSPLSANLVSAQILPSNTGNSLQNCWRPN